MFTPISISPLLAVGAPRLLKTTWRERKLRMAVCILVLMLIGVESMVHKLVIERDERRLYKIESYCFVLGGKAEVEVSEYREHKVSGRSGFLLRKAASESMAQQELEESLEQNSCLLDFDDRKTKQKIEFKENQKNAKMSFRVADRDDEGLYSLIFIQCPKEGEEKEKDKESYAILDLREKEKEVSQAIFSYKLQAKFVNPGPRYLSACDAYLPEIFGIYFLLYMLLSLIWFYLLFRTFFHRQTLKVHYVHWCMGILLLFKVMAMLSQSMRYFYIDKNGEGEGWQFVYYVFASLKGMALFVVILLIGTGWSLVKSYLNAKEKQIIAIVLSLQIVDNIALVFFDQTAPGSQSWLTWRDVLHLIDIICCASVLFPIIWSIRHLRQAAQADGKTLNNIHKLTLFRQFYIMVVSYIYFTRIIVFLLVATLPFNLLWLRYIFSESATLLFYLVTGIKFRPREHNPYLPLKQIQNNQFLDTNVSDSDSDNTNNHLKFRASVEVEVDTEFGKNRSSVSPHMHNPSLQSAYHELSFSPSTSPSPGE